MAPHERVAPLQQRLEVLQDDRSSQRIPFGYVRRVAATPAATLAFDPGIVALQRIEYQRVPFDGSLELTSRSQRTSDGKRGTVQRSRKQRVTWLEEHKVGIRRDTCRIRARNEWRIGDEW